MYLLLGREGDECLDAAGVDWLREHLGAGGSLTPNGHALVAYLRREAAAVHPALAELA